MLHGSLNTVVTSLPGGKTLPSTAAAPAQANAAERAEKAAEKAARDTPPAATTTPGVIFDLSEAALQAVAAASATPDSQAGATAATAVPQAPPPFLPAGLTIATEIAAANVPAATATTASAATSQSTAATSATAAGAASAAVQETALAASSTKVEEAADPDEEARARAHAIQAQEGEQVLSLVEQLAEAGTEASVSLTAPADAASEDKATAA